VVDKLYLAPESDKHYLMPCTTDYPNGTFGGQAMKFFKKTIITVLILVLVLAGLGVKTLSVRMAERFMWPQRWGKKFTYMIAT
jgi:hypothetical protein